MSNILWLSRLQCPNSRVLQTGEPPSVLVVTLRRMEKVNTLRYFLPRTKFVHITRLFLYSLNVTFMFHVNRQATSKTEGQHQTWILTSLHQWLLRPPLSGSLKRVEIEGCERREGKTWFRSITPLSSFFVGPVVELVFYRIGLLVCNLNCGTFFILIILVYSLMLLRICSRERCIVC